MDEKQMIVYFVQYWFDSKQLSATFYCFISKLLNSNTSVIAINGLKLVKCFKAISDVQKWSC